MRGTMITITPSGSKIEQTFNKPVPLDDLQEAVGGYIEQVPGLRLYHRLGAPVDCVAFCNEEGKLKGLTLNTTATQLWHRQYPTSDVLVGNVVVLFGDAAFMRSI